MKTIKKRRIEGVTDYKSRLNLLKSSLPRVVIRRTNKYIIVQYVESKNAQDSVKSEVTSKKLFDYGWAKENAGSLKSLPACYLTGFLLGKKIDKKNKKAILDIGLERNIPKGRLYSVLKGLIDAGMDIKHKEKIFPDEKRIRGEHMKNKINFDDIKNKISKEKNDK